MANLLPRHFFYAVLVFTIFITGTVYVLNLVIEGESGNKETSVPGLMDSTHITSFNRTFTPNATENIDELQDKMEELKLPEDFSLTAGVTLSVALIQTAWAMIKFIIGSFGFMNDAIIGLSTFLHVPVWLPYILISMIVAFFVFSILTIIFGKEI